MIDEITRHKIASLADARPMRETLFEQEMPALAYDAGMPLCVVQHHFFFGPRHVDVRTPVIDFLRQREQPKQNPPSDSR